MKDISTVLTTEHKPAWYDAHMTREKYRAQSRLNPSALAKGLLGIGEVDPLSVKLAWETPDATDRTAATQDRMDCGTLAHLMVLQPELLAKKIVIWDGDKRAGERWELFQEDNPDKLIMRERDYAATFTAINAIKNEQRVVDLVRGIEAEVALFSCEKVNTCGKFINVMGQVDGINFAKRTIVDLKTTERGIDQRSVEQTIRTFSNREKMALYLRWAAAATQTDPESWQCWNLFVLMTPPYGVRTVKFSSFAMEWGLERMQVVLEDVGECLQSGEWPVFSRYSGMTVEDYESLDEIEELDYGT